MTVVLLHAFPLDERMWAPQRQALAEEEVEAPNLYDLEGSSLDVWAERLLGDVEGELVLVGASMGGYLALAMAASAPDRVRGLLLAGARPDADSPERRTARADTIALVEDQGAKGLWETMRPKLLAEDAPDDTVALARDSSLARSRDELIRAVEAIRDRRDSTALVDSLEVPVVFAVGAGDSFFPVDEARAAADRAKNGRVVVFDGSAHLPNLEQPEEFNATLRELLQAAR